MSRIDDRANDELRPMQFHTDFLANALSSVLIECGKTRIICAVSAVQGVPRWMQNQGVAGGWLTSEYQMLPAAGGGRKPRDVTAGRVNGRAQEIQRLIGRSLRAVVDLTKVGSNTIYVDCDVIDADGGTRCASINGACVALKLAFKKMFLEERIRTIPIDSSVAAVSVGIVDGTPMLDLCYPEDAGAAVDLNVVMTSDNKFIEIQGTAEETPFSRDEMDTMLALAQKGIGEIVTEQEKALTVRGQN